MILSVIFCLLITLGLHWFFPAWWWVMAVPLAWCAVNANAGKDGFLIGLLSSGLLWFGAGLYYLYTSGEGIAPRVATMLQLGSPELLIAITALIAAIAGGLAGCLGGLLRSVRRRAEN